MPLEIRAVCGAPRRLCDLRKPAGVPTHAAMDNASQNALSALSAQLGVRLLPTSRLDVPTSGLLLLRAHRCVSVALQRRAARAARGEGVHRARAARQCDAGWRIAVAARALDGARRPRAEAAVAEPCGDAQRCESVLLSARRVRARVRGSGGGVELLEVRLKLETGRTHQLRAQLAFEGCPIVGDELYGSPSLEALAADAAAAAAGGDDDFVVLPTEPIALHACRLGFPALEGGAWQEFELAPGWRVEEKPTTLLSLPEELVRHILCCVAVPAWHWPTSNITIGRAARGLQAAGGARCG